MKNWSVDETELKKNPEQYTAWRLEQLIKFGLDGEKIDKAQLKKYWSTIDIDPAKRRFLQLLLNEN